MLVLNLCAVDINIKNDTNTNNKYNTITQEDKLWNEVKKINKISVYRMYLENYPNGTYKIIALHLIDELSKQTKKDMPKWVLYQKADYVAYGIVNIDKEYYDTETYIEKVNIGKRLAYEKLVNDFFLYDTNHGYKKDDFKTKLYEMPNGDLYVMVYYDKLK